MMTGVSSLGTHLCKLWRKVCHHVHGRDRPQDDVPLTSFFAVSVEAAGFLLGTVHSKPQCQLYTEMEQWYVERLQTKVTLYCEQNMSEVSNTIMVFLQVDRVSSQFVGTPMGPATCIDSDAYKEVWSTYLMLSSPIL